VRELVSCIDIICTLLESFWLYFVVDTLFERKYFNNFFTRNKAIILLISILITSGIVTLMNSMVLVSPYTLIVMMLSMIICTWCFWKVDIQSAVAVIGMYVFCIYIYSGILIILIKSIGGIDLLSAITMEQGVERLVFLILYHMIWAFLNIILVYIIRKRILVGGNIKKYMYISIIGLIGSIYFSVQLLTSLNIELNFMWYLFLAVMVILIYGSYYKTKIENFQHEKELLLKHTNLLEKNYEQLSTFYNENAKLYHDMNHHLNVIHNLLEEGTQLQAKAYIEEIITPVNRTKVPSKCGIDILDVVLYEMGKKAQEKQIKLDVSITTLHEDGSIGMKDLSLLLVNLLDNAIEAAKERVSLSIKQVYQMVFIEVVNDYKEKPKKVGSRFQTTKDKKQHGWGIQIIENIVKKYDGNLEYKVDEVHVYAEIMLNN